jgi:hypothetical protein
MVRQCYPGLSFAEGDKASAAYLTNLVETMSGHGLIFGGKVTEGATDHVDTSAALIKPNMSAAYRAGVFTSVPFEHWNLSARHATLPRRDLVYVDNLNSLNIAFGTPGASPNPPELGVNYIGLAIIYVPPTGGGAITITDIRTPMDPEQFAWREEFVSTLIWTSNITGDATNTLVDGTVLEMYVGTSGPQYAIMTVPVQIPSGVANLNGRWMRTRIIPNVASITNSWGIVGWTLHDATVANEFTVEYAGIKIADTHFYLTSATGGTATDVVLGALDTTYYHDFDVWIERDGSSTVIYGMMDGLESTLQEITTNTPAMGGGHHIGARVNRPGAGDTALRLYIDRILANVKRY